MAAREHKPGLALLGLGAMFLAYLLGFGVLNHPDMVSKFENGVAPPEVFHHRFNAVGSVVLGVGGAVSAFASRVTGAIVLVLVAGVPFVLLSLVVLQLAF